MSEPQGSARVAARRRRGSPSRAGPALAFGTSSRCEAGTAATDPRPFARRRRSTPSAPSAAPCPPCPPDARPRARRRARSPSSGNLDRLVEEVERRLDALLEVSSGGPDRESRRRAAAALANLAARLELGVQGSPDLLADTVGHLLGGPLEPRASVEAQLAPLLETLYRRWFRVQLHGAERVPTDRPALLVANRVGDLLWEGLLLRTGLRLSRGRAPIWLAEDAVHRMPLLGTMARRLGAVRADPAVARQLLAREALLAVFTEVESRAQGARGGLGSRSLVRLALAAGALLVPVAVVAAPPDGALLAQESEAPSAIALELLPRPGRWAIEVGEPLEVSPAAGDDPDAVRRLDARLRMDVDALSSRARRRIAAAA